MSDILPIRNIRITTICIIITYTWGGGGVLKHLILINKKVEHTESRDKVRIGTNGNLYSALF